MIHRPVNYLVVNDSHSFLASSEFSIKMVDVGNPVKVVTLHNHETLTPGRVSSKSIFSHLSR